MMSEEIEPEAKTSPVEVKIDFLAQVPSLLLQANRNLGLKAQHAMCVKWLALVTNAKLDGAAPGKKEFTMIPMTGPGEFLDRDIRLHADTPASILLVFQALFPFLAFAGNAKGEPITLTIMGGTNVMFSLSYEYIDQVVLPMLELLGVPKVERKLECRGWSHGAVQIGSIKFRFTPLAPGQSLDTSLWPKSTESDPVKQIDITIIVPRSVREPLKASLKFELGLVFPGVETSIVVDEDSRHPARLYTLLVAHTTNGFRFGRDWLYDKTVKGKTSDVIATNMAQKVVDELDSEIRKGGCVDEYLQDQLVVFQALAKGRTVIFDSPNKEETDLDEIFDRTNEPFGNGNLHTRTAKWVVGQLLPQVRWFDKGRICEGVGYTCKSTLSTENSLSAAKLE
jgi:RNA 3'-terminal phosphate cyclase (ATP)